MSLSAKQIAPVPASPSRINDARDRVEAWQDHQAELLGQIAEWRGTTEHSERLARSVCALAVTMFCQRWADATESDQAIWRNGAIPRYVRASMERAVAQLDGLPLSETSYLLSGLYPRLLPRGVRARLGVYYTPSVLTERLLNLAEDAGIDWSDARVLDPACGGGAFLLPVAQRMLDEPKIAALPPEARLRHLESHLFGIEIDAFAAWMTRQFLFLLTHDLRRLAGRSLDVPVLDADALQQVDRACGQFDLVVGNPPYGRVALDTVQRQNFSRSLFGHANVFGVFLDAALRWRQENGIVAFVTPTSLLSGQYFSKLRTLLLREAPPIAIDVVHERTGVFDTVQQETCLAVFGDNPQKFTQVHLLTTRDGVLSAQKAGRFPLSDQPRAPWMLPRTREQARVAKAVGKMKTRLHNLGYRASTGPLVWNRHKDQLRNQNDPGTYPLIWAEAVRCNQFSFDYHSRADVPFFYLQPDQGHLLYRQSCVLVQRTTAKEQHRRLIACAVPDSFLKTWSGIVVENHVNILRQTDPGTVCPASLAAVLNTRVVDLIFRCISGSVAVSATELHALPLPPPEVFARVTEELQGPMEAAMLVIETLVAEAYGVGDLARLA